MYLEHFGLHRFPFRIAPDPALLFLTADHHRAVDLLMRAARGEAPAAMILGDPGTGKTTLLKHFVTGLPSNTPVGMITNFSSGLGGLGQWLHWAFALPKNGSKRASMATVEAFLRERRSAGDCPLLIVDEAQNVSDADIDSLLALTCLPGESGATLRLVLAGQPRLRRRFPALHGPGETRSSHQVCLGSLSEEEVAGYVRHRMAASGCAAQVFAEATLVRIARLTAGVPRRVNVLCELLLTSAFSEGASLIDAALVDRVLKEIRRSGMLDHLLVQQGPPEARDVSRALTLVPTPASPDVEPVEERTNPLCAEPDAPSLPQMHADREVAPLPVAMTVDPAPPQGVANMTGAPEEGQPRRRHAARWGGAVGGVAAAGGLALLLSQVFAPAPTVAALLSASVAGADAGAARGDAGATQPALPAPTTVDGMDAGTLHDQALRVGASDPLAAAIGFARAAIRGDARAAYYLGQHYEAGDGVPRNPTLAAAWYEMAAESQRGARLALRNLEGASAPHANDTEAPPRPLMGIVLPDGQGEFVWSAADESAAQYLVELAAEIEATATRFGPFDLSAVLLEGARDAKVWRIAAISPDGTWLSASDWHVIARPAGTPVAVGP